MKYIKTIKTYKDDLVFSSGIALSSVAVAMLLYVDWRIGVAVVLYDMGKIIIKSFDE